MRKHAANPVLRAPFKVSLLLEIHVGFGLKKFTLLCASWRNSSRLCRLKKKKVQNFLGKKNPTVTEQLEEDKILCTYLNIFLN